VQDKAAVEHAYVPAYIEMNCTKTEKAMADSRREEKKGIH
jgi:hypothetical protein